MSNIKGKQFIELYPTFSIFSTKVLSEVNEVLQDTDFINDSVTFYKQAQLYKALVRRFRFDYSYFDDQTTHDHMINALSDRIPWLHGKTLKLGWINNLTFSNIVSNAIGVTSSNEMNNTNTLEGTNTNNNTIDGTNNGETQQDPSVLITPLTGQKGSYNNTTDGRNTTNTTNTITGANEVSGTTTSTNVNSGYQSANFNTTGLLTEFVNSRLFLNIFSKTQLNVANTFQGEKGEKGESGEQGAPGVQGEKGEQGEPGIGGGDGVDFEYVNNAVRTTGNFDTREDIADDGSVIVESLSVVNNNGFSMLEFKYLDDEIDFKSPVNVPLPLTPENAASRLYVDQAIAGIDSGDPILPGVPIDIYQDTFNPTATPATDRSEVVLNNFQEFGNIQTTQGVVLTNKLLRQNLNRDGINLTLQCKMEPSTEHLIDENYCIGFQLIFSLPETPVGFLDYLTEEDKITFNEAPFTVRIDGNHSFSYKVGHNWFGTVRFGDKTRRGLQYYILNIPIPLSKSTTNSGNCINFHRLFQDTNDNRWVKLNIQLDV